MSPNHKSSTPFQITNSKNSNESQIKNDKNNNNTNKPEESTDIIINNSLLIDPILLENAFINTQSNEIFKIIMKEELSKAAMVNILRVLLQRAFEICFLSHSNPLKIFTSSFDSIITKESRVIFNGKQYYRVLPITEILPHKSDTSDFDKIIFVMYYINKKIENEEILSHIPRKTNIPITQEDINRNFDPYKVHSPHWENDKSEIEENKKYNENEIKLKDYRSFESTLRFIAEYENEKGYIENEENIKRSITPNVFDEDKEFDSSEKKKITKEELEEMMEKEKISKKDFNIDFSKYEENTKAQAIVDRKLNHKKTSSIELGIKNIGLNTPKQNSLASSENKSHNLKDSSSKSNTNKKENISTKQSKIEKIQTNTQNQQISIKKEMSELEKCYREIFRNFVSNYILVFDNTPTIKSYDELKQFSHIFPETTNELGNYPVIDFFDTWKLLAAVREVIKERKQSESPITGCTEQQKENKNNGITILQDNTKTECDWPVANILHKIQSIKYKNWSEIEAKRDNLIEREREKCKDILYNAMYEDLCQKRQLREKNAIWLDENDVEDVTKSIIIEENASNEETEEEITAHLIKKLFGRNRTYESLNTTEHKILALTRYKERQIKLRKQKELLEKQEKLQKVNPYNSNIFNSPISKKSPNIGNGIYNSWDYVPYIDSMHVPGSQN